MRKRKNYNRYLSLVVVLSMILTMFHLPFAKQARADESWYGAVFPKPENNTVKFIVNDNVVNDVFVAGAFNQWNPRVHGETYKLRMQADEDDGNKQKKMLILTMSKAQLHPTADFNLYGDIEFKFNEVVGGDVKWKRLNGQEGGGNERFPWKKEEPVLNSARHEIDLSSKQVNFHIETQKASEVHFGYKLGNDGSWTEVPFIKGEYRENKQKWNFTLDMEGKAEGIYQFKFKLFPFESEGSDAVYINESLNPSDGANSSFEWRLASPPQPPAETTADFQIIASSSFVSEYSPVELIAVEVDEKKNIKVLEGVTWKVEGSPEGIWIQDSKLRVEAATAPDTEITVKAHKDETPTEVAVKTFRVKNENVANNQTLLHFYNQDKNYTGWNNWVFKGNMPGAKVDFTTDSDIGKTAFVEKESKVIVRRREGSNDWAEQTKTYVLPAGAENAYIIKDDDNLYTSLKEAYLASGPRVRAAIMDSKTQLKAYLTEEPLAGVNFGLYKNGSPVSGILTNVTGTTLQISGITDFDPTALYEVKADHMFTKPREVTKRRVLDGYTSDEKMGVNYEGENVNFRIWAPTAHKVELLVYNTDHYDNMSAPYDVFLMTHNTASGTYHITKNKKTVHNKYYLYRLSFHTRSSEENLFVRQTYAVDPYAIATGLNGKMGFITDINDASLKPAEWDSHKKPELKKPEDSIIYEMHVRDFTIAPSWTGEESFSGKFLGVAQEGTTYTNSGTTVKTGLDHLEELGITHVHLLPVYDIASIEENGSHAFNAKQSNNIDFNRNWGYDPQNYNALEGSYATDPAHPTKVIKEFRTMVWALHKKGIRVVLDQVFNHMYSTENMDKIVPGYYFRTDDYGRLTDGAGCGNEVATERPMVRKFIVDSNLMWLTNYKVDGLRFDLMALIDKGTMNEVQKKAREIDKTVIVYGEPWKAFTPTPLPESEQTKKGNEGIAAFNDTYRGALRGDNGNDQGFVSKGFVQGSIDAHYQNVHEGLRGFVNRDVNDPELMINYAEAHDNYAIFDQIERSENNAILSENYRKGLDASNILNEWKVKKALLANGFVLTSQGLAFFQGGSEILRTKKGDHNSYKSDDTTNAIHWEDKITYKKVFDFYRDLIKIRKDHPAFRLTSKADIGNHQTVNSLMYKNHLIYNHLKNNAGGDRWKNIVVIYNGSTEDETISWLPRVPSSKWKILFDKDGLHEGSLREVTQAEDGGLTTPLSLSSSSFMILFDEEGVADNIRWDYLFADQSADYMSPLEPTDSQSVKVRFRALTGEVSEAKVHYYDEEDRAEHSLAMTKITDDSFYSEKGYDKSKVEFWEGEIPASGSRKYYQFEVKNGTRTAYISGGKGENNRGVTDVKPALKGFWIVPNYTTPDWTKEAVFYQIMVDRFRDGDSSNNRVAKDVSQFGQPSEVSPWGSELFKGNESDRIWNNQFFGGDLIGVKEALPYLDYLGITSLYLMPIFQSGSDHKYDIDDYKFVDKNFGGNKSLAQLSAAMQTKGMKLVLDGVFNHTSTEGEFFKENKESYYFYEKGGYVDKAKPTPNRIDYYPWHGYTNLAKLNYQKDEVKNYIYKDENSVAKHYLKAPYYIDGWRLDAAEDVNVEPRDYKSDSEIDIKTSQSDEEQKKANLAIWKEFREEVKKTKSSAFILGEFWGDENQWYKERAWDSKMNYGGFMMPFIENNSKNPYMGNHSFDNKGQFSVADIGKYTRDYFAKFPYQTILTATNSISTHDKERFLNREFTGEGNAAMMQLAVALQMTYPGVPMIYYGDEIGTRGKGSGEDPYNRGTFNWDVNSWNEASRKIFKDHKTLIETRKKDKNAFVYGAFEEISSHNDQKYLAYARYGNGSRAVVILNNNGGLGLQNIKLPHLQRYGFKEGEKLVDVLSGKTVTIDLDETTFPSENMTASVWVYESKKPTAITEIRFNPTDESDEREKLSPVQNPKFETKEDEIVVSWDAYRTVTGAKEISVSVYEGNKKVKEKIAAIGDISVSFEKDGLKSEFSIEVKVIADRTLTKGSDLTNDSYFDSDFVTAKDRNFTHSIPSVYLEEMIKAEEAKKQEKEEGKEEGAGGKEGDADLNASVDSGNSTGLTAGVLVIKKEKKATVKLDKKLVKRALKADVTKLVIRLKKAAVEIGRDALKKIVGKKVGKLEFKADIVKKTKNRSERKALKSHLKGKSLLHKAVYKISLTEDGKNVNRLKLGKHKFKIRLSVNLKNAPKSVYVMEINTGKMYKAKYHKKSKTLSFKTNKVGKFVIVKKVSKNGKNKK